MPLRLTCIALLVTVVTTGCSVAADPLEAGRFTRPGSARQWVGRHDLASLKDSAEGLVFVSNGSDPYATGPVIDMASVLPESAPEVTQLLIKLRVRSQSGGSWQVFYFPPTGGPAEERSVRIPAPSSTEFIELTAPISVSGNQLRLRIDPPLGTSILERIWFERPLRVTPPRWPQPDLAPITTGPRIASGLLELRHSGSRWNDFAVLVDGQEMARGWNQPLIGYLSPALSQKSADSPDVRWVDLASAARVTQLAGSACAVTAEFDDPDGAKWTLTQSFAADRSGAVACQVSVSVTKPRQIVHLPLMLVMVGQGARKNQGLFAGLEYLSDEPSSSTADLEGPAALRRVPHRHTWTFPLLAIQQAEWYVGLTWDGQQAAFFDSPDRTFGSTGHVLGLLALPLDAQRIAGELFPFEPLLLEPAHPLQTRCVLIGGTGKSVSAAVRDEVTARGTWDWTEDRTRPMPAATPVRAPVADRAEQPTDDSPATVPDSLWATAWLDTPIREGANYRHALPATHFAAHPAMDAAWIEEYLATQLADPALAARLRESAAEAVNAVAVESRLEARVGHVWTPAGVLVHGDVAAALSRAKGHAAGQLARFGKDGAVPYQPGKVDFGKTHSTREASGIAGLAAAEFLEWAAFSGDEELRREVPRVLACLDRFRHDVPRGAQTWEIPLHTPDILASAHMVRAYTLGYELTGDAAWLDLAEEWAWTGVPFVYLRQPTIDGPPQVAAGQASDAPGTTRRGQQRVGQFATTPVLGATHWQAPVWIGLPVQWCGLVYADALTRLSQYTELRDATRERRAPPWGDLARRIIESARQQLYPAGHPLGGLLPDSFDLRTQQRNPFDINPATWQVPALRFSGRCLTQRRLEQTGWRLVAPAQLINLREEADMVTLQLQGWATTPWHVLIHGLPDEPRITWDGQLPGDVQLVDQHGRRSAILKVRQQSITMRVARQP